MAFNSSQITKPEDADRIGEWLMQQVDMVLNSAVAKPIEQLAQALAPVIIIGLTIQFLFYTMAIMRGYGNMTVTELVWKYLRIALIASVATAGGFYQTHIANVMISLPDDMVAVVSGKTTVAQEIDQLRQSAQNAADSTNKIDTGLLPSTKDILVRVMKFGIHFNAMIVGAVIAILMIVVKVGMALVVATGPIFISALAFDRTEGMFNSWVSQALNFVFLALLAGLLFAVLIQINISYVEKMADLITGGKVDIIPLVIAQLLVAIASIFVMIMIPGIAQGLSGGFGAQFGVGSASRGAMSALRAGHLVRKLLGR
ncbi:type IV secretion system protein [Alcaligenes sp. 13f]|uniref:type IV secretion system protein n=1 Tax=Alcaligenes sp. 13f TaxID=2841924 RepID=UPI001CF62D26|nr:type IV secretion system protein [Alcaligenes sp. 13f]